MKEYLIFGIFALLLFAGMFYGLHNQRPAPNDIWADFQQAREQRTRDTAGMTYSQRLQYDNMMDRLSR